MSYFFALLPLPNTSLNRKSGKTRLATTVASQIISVAITRLAIPVILRPSVTSVVTSKPTNVVTRAIPPSRYGAF